MLRKLLLTTQVVFFCVFVFAFVSSFFVVDEIKEKSKTLITEKVVEGTSSQIDLAEELINSKTAAQYLADYQLEAIQEEIDSFKENPYAYIEAITLDATQSSIIPPALESKNQLKNALLKKIFAWKSGLKNHFERTFKGLVTDLRIFIGSNILSLLVAAFICYKQKVLGKESMAISSILTGVIALSSLSYLDQNWLFSIILNSYSGYGYPLGIFVATLWLCYEYFKSRSYNAE